MENSYLNRILDDLLKEYIESTPALWVAGPKWCGKSTTCLRQAKSVVFLQDTKSWEQNKLLAESDPRRFLSGDAPKMIDEWQLLPFLWDAIRFEADRRNELGQFILTGSATPVETGEIKHSGIGRIDKLLMRPMTLFESKESTGQVSLKMLFDGVEKVEGECALRMEDYAHAACRGGWPQTVGLPPRIALRRARAYYRGLVEDDVSKVDGIARNPARVSRLLRSYARMTGTQASYDSIRKDMSPNSSEKLVDKTLASYINALKKLYVVEDMEAWCPQLTTKAAIRTSDTRYLVDPSIACAALDATPANLMDDLRTFGKIFENMAVRDLRVYAQALDGSVSHYRDHEGLEIDAIIHLADGRYGLCEVKMLAESNIAEGVRNLLKLASIIDGKAMRKPSFLAVITGTDIAYRRPDGVFVIPLGCLKP